jgi:hypothetical protein
VGVDRSTLWRVRQADPEFGAAVLHAEGEAARKVMDVIWGSIENGDAKAAMWWLEHRRPRQWGEQTTRYDNDRDEDEHPELAFLR